MGLADTSPAMIRFGGLAVCLALVGCGVAAEPEPVVEPLRGGTTVATVAHDGVRFDVKLTLPAGEGPFPVVAFFFGDGPTSKSLYGLYESLSGALVERGIGFFSWDTRGCRDSIAPPFYVIDEAVYATATPTHVLGDARAALDWLDAAPGVDADHVVLWAHGMGTVLAPQLAGGDGADALVLSGWLAQRPDDVLADAFTYRTWYAASLVADRDGDGAITANEWDRADKTALEADGYGSFASLDTDGDGLYTAADNVADGAPIVDQIHALAILGDEPTWRSFWGESWIYAPSTRWARDTWIWPSPIPALANLHVPARAIVLAADVQAPLTRLAPLLAAVDAGAYPSLSYDVFPQGDLGWYELAVDGISTPPLAAALDAASNLAGD
jgi:hypothetical protein